MAITSSFLFSKEKSLPTASCKTPPDSNPQNTTLDNSSAITVHSYSLLASFRLAFRSHVFLVNHASAVPLPSHPAPWRSSPITTTSSISRAVCCCSGSWAGKRNTPTSRKAIRAALHTAASRWPSSGRNRRGGPTPFSARCTTTAWPPTCSSSTTNNCCARLRLSSVLETQRLALAAHASQQAWLDAFQGAVAFVDVLGTMSRAVGKMSGAFEHARGSSDREFPA